MQIEDIKEFAKSVTKQATAELLAKGSPEPGFFLLDKQGNMSIYPIPGEAMNEPSIKRALGTIMRQEVKRKNAVGVVFVSDVFRGELKKGLTAEQVAEINDIGIEAASKKGYLTARESILVTVESPIYKAMLYQFYKRGKRNEPGTGITLEELEETVCDDHNHFTGRFIGFFDEEQPIDTGTTDEIVSDILGSNKGKPQ
jgi:hypothetical protein